MGNCYQQQYHEIEETNYHNERRTNSKLIDKPNGLSNLGNSCYLNAILQMIANNPILQQKITQQHPKKESNKLNHLFNDLLKRLKTNNQSPDEIWKWILNRREGFIRFKQHDASELYLLLMNNLGDEITGSLRILTEIHFDCGNRDHYEISNNINFCLYVAVQNPKGSNLQELVDNQYSISNCNEAGYDCDKCEKTKVICNKDSEAEKNIDYLSGNQVHKVPVKTFTKITQFPRVFVIHLNLYTQRGIKLKSQISYTEKICIQGKHYLLNGLVVHKGNRMKSGHYIAYVKYNQKEWFKVN